MKTPSLSLKMQKKPKTPPLPRAQNGRRRLANFRRLAYYLPSDPGSVTSDLLLTEGKPTDWWIVPERRELIYFCVPGTCFANATGLYCGTMKCLAETFLPPRFSPVDKFKVTPNNASPAVA
jgi:hypothetical protein